MRTALWLLTTMLMCGGAAGADWPRFGGPTADFKSPEKGIVTTWAPTGPKLVWAIDTGEGYCAPAIADGRLFLFERIGDQQVLRCLDPRTAQKKWAFSYPTDYVDMYKYDGGPRAMPVVDGDRVYILGPEGMLHCLSVADGSIKWKLDTIKEFNVVPNFFGVGAAPVVEGDLLIVQVGGSPLGSPPKIAPDLRGNGSGIVAFNKLTGKVVYSITDELASFSVPVMADIDGRRWGIVFARGGLVGFDPRNGKVDFHYPWRARIFESAIASNPVVVGDKVFISECYEVGGSLLSVRPGGYEVVWKDPGTTRGNTLACHWMTPIYHKGFLYGCSGRHDQSAELRCVGLETRRIMWAAKSMSVPLMPDGKGPSEVRLTRCSLTMADGLLILLGEYGQLALVRPTPEKFDLVASCLLSDGKGEPLFEEHAWSAPVLSNGLLYLRGKGRLACLELIPRAN